MLNTEVKQQVNSYTISRNEEAQNLASHDNSFPDPLKDIKEAFKLTLALTQGGLPAIAAEVGENIMMDAAKDILVDAIIGREEADLEQDSNDEHEAIVESVASIRAANSGNMPIVGEDPFASGSNAAARNDQASADVAASTAA